MDSETVESFADIGTFVWFLNVALAGERRVGVGQLLGGGMFKVVRSGRVSELEAALGAEPFDRNWATIEALRAHGRADVCREIVPYATQHPRL